MRDLSWLVCALLVPSLLFSQAAATDAIERWQVLRTVPRGREVAVDLRSGERVQGKLATVSDSAITVRGQQQRRDQTIARGDVFKVFARRAPRHRSLFTGIGLGVGVLAGLVGATYFALSPCLGRSCAAESTGMVASAVGLPVGGALAGRALAGKGELELVYLAR